MKTLSKSGRFLFLIALAVLQYSCAAKLSESITNETTPTEVDKTTILVSMFEYQDPIVYDPFYLNKAKSDSLRNSGLFSYSNDMLKNTQKVEGRAIKIEHPLIKETNGKLKKYNRMLAHKWKKYNYSYILVRGSEIEKSPEYADKEKYRYILRAEPITLCIVDPDESTYLEYRYRYYFFDRKLNQEMPEVEVFSAKISKTNAAIIYKLNHLYKI